MSASLLNGPPPSPQTLLLSYPISTPHTISPSGHPNNTALSPIRLLLSSSSGLRRTTLLLLSAWCFYSFSSNGFFTYLPLLYEARDIGSNLYRDVVLSSLIGLPGIFVAGALLETSLGRRKVLAVSMVSKSNVCPSSVQIIGVVYLVH